MKQVPPLPGEEALYKWIGGELQAAAKNPEIKQTLKETAVGAEQQLITPLFQCAAQLRKVPPEEWRRDAAITLDVSASAPRSQVFSYR
jgi:hypothetical protein